MPDKTTEEVLLPSAGSIPGIPGSHAPGRYLVNWVERTATRIVEAVEQVVERPKKKGTVSPAADPANQTQA
jgi:hypothetical protein